MEKYTIKELGEFINAINKNPDSAIELQVDRTGGIISACNGAAGLSLKITPPAPVCCKGAGKCKNDKTEQ